MAYFLYKKAYNDVIVRMFCICSLSFCCVILERLVEISKTGYLYDLELIDAIELLSHDDENSSLLCIMHTSSKGG